MVAAVAAQHGRRDEVVEEGQRGQVAVAVGEVADHVGEVAAAAAAAAAAGGGVEEERVEVVVVEEVGGEVVGRGGDAGRADRRLEEGGDGGEEVAGRAAAARHHAAGGTDVRVVGEELVLRDVYFKLSGVLRTNCTILK